MENKKDKDRKVFLEENMEKTSKINDYVGVAPIDFLKSKLGREVSLNELLLLDYIVETYEFEVGVTNLFVEQVLKMNNNKFSRGFTLKVAGQWDICNFSTFTAAEEYAEKELEKYYQLQRRDNFGIVRELTTNEKEIVNRLYYKSSFDDAILDLAISYCMKINDGYIISWFVNRIIEYLEAHSVEDKEEAQMLLDYFHKTHVVNFGFEQKENW